MIGLHTKGGIVLTNIILRRTGRKVTGAELAGQKPDGTFISTTVKLTQTGREGVLNWSARGQRWREIGSCGSTYKQALDNFWQYHADDVFDRDEAAAYEYALPEERIGTQTLIAELARRLANVDDIRTSQHVLGLLKD